MCIRSSAKNLYCTLKNDDFLCFIWETVVRVRFFSLHKSGSSLLIILHFCKYKALVVESHRRFFR